MSFEDDASDAPHDPLAEWPAFARGVRGRLGAGERQYGTVTFERPAYAFIAWSRVLGLRARLANLEHEIACSAENR